MQTRITKVIYNPPPRLLFSSVLGGRCHSSHFRDEDTETLKGPSCPGVSQPGRAEPGLVPVDLTAELTAGLCHQLPGCSSHRALEMSSGCRRSRSSLTEEGTPQPRELEGWCARCPWWNWGLFPSPPPSPLQQAAREAFGMPLKTTVPTKHCHSRANARPRGRPAAKGAALPWNCGCSNLGSTRQRNVTGARPLSSLGFGLLIHEMGIIVTTRRGSCED